MEPQIGQWWQVKAGPQRGQSGVVDHVRDFPTGRYFRLVHPHTKAIVGRFRAEQLVPATAPEYVSRVDAQPTQRAMDLIMAPRREA
jgi:hypothetical protein